MVHKPLALGASLALALQLAALPAPGAAQDYPTWNDDRPDGVPPAGLYTARTVPAGVFELGVSYTSYDHLGTRFGSQFLSFQELFSFFELAPFALSTDLFVLNGSYGVDDDLTLVGRLGWVEHKRNLVDEDDNLITQESDGLSDLEVHALWEIYEQGPWRAHLQGGVSVPTGSVDAEDEVAGRVLPYDMQTGAGVVGFLPGVTVRTMNEQGSVGLQLLGRIYVGENDRGWRPGHAAEANGWAAYRFNRFFSLSSGFRATAWNAIEGFDADLDPERDPGERPISFAGERVDVPIGLNLVMPEGRLEGHRLSVEFLFNVHEELEGPWLAADDGFVITWQKAF